jgi:hypothetical protein
MLKPEVWQALQHLIIAGVFSLMPGNSDIEMRTARAWWRKAWWRRAGSRCASFAVLPPRAMRADA